LPFGDEPDGDAGGGGPDPGHQCGRQQADDDVVGPDGEGSLQAAQVEAAPGFHERVRLLDELVKPPLDGERPRGGYEAASSANQDGVVEGPADAPKRPARRGNRQVQALGRGGNAALGQQHVERAEEVPVDILRHTQECIENK
jgi:hypothetical protein